MIAQWFAKKGQKCAAVLYAPSSNQSKDVSLKRTPGASSDRQLCNAI